MEMQRGTRVLMQKFQLSHRQNVSVCLQFIYFRLNLRIVESRQGEMQLPRIIMRLKADILAHRNANSGVQFTIE